jgi:hypothetical protein
LAGLSGVARRRFPASTAGTSLGYCDAGGHPRLRSAGDDAVGGARAASHRAGGVADQQFPAPEVTRPSPAGTNSSPLSQAEALGEEAGAEERPVGGAGNRGGEGRGAVR